MSGANKEQIFSYAELEAEMQKEKDKREESLSYKASKHSLDSDEEDDDGKIDKYNIMDPNEFEGQEDQTIEFDGEIKITPFNMKEELEEGYFDKEGTYIFQKEEDVIKDQWLDDIDWIKVKAREESKRKQEEEESDSEDERPPINLTEKYSEMLKYMKPGETVLKAICRLGGSNSSRSASRRWKKKREAEATAESSAKNEADVEKLELLTGLANEIITSGDMDIYQQTYEKMSFYLSSCLGPKDNETNGSASSKKDAELDMFGDDFEEKVDEDKMAMPPPQTPSPTSGSVNAEAEVMWEFKWEAAEDAKVYGPYPTSQMQQWVNDQYFEDGVLVRQVDKQDAEFYSSKRIDFELYM